MAQTATINVESFDLREAVDNGTPVTLRSSVSDIETQTGILRKKGDLYEVTIGNTTYKAYSNGKLVDREGSLNLVTAEMVTTRGTEQAMTRGEESGKKDLGVISNLEPRDHFAMVVLQALLNRLTDIEKVNDSTILLYCRSCYRWAQGMMIASADARAQVPVTPPTEVDVDPQSFTENMEKVMYNIYAALKEGLMVSGSTKQDAVPIETKITEMPEITIDGGGNFATQQDVQDAAQDVIDAMPSTSGLATSSDVSDAEANIIAAMPHCNYTPPANNT